MENLQRGRSPSSGHPSSARHTPAASPGPAYRSQLNPTASTASTTTASLSAFDPQSTSFAHRTDYSLAASAVSQPSFEPTTDYNAPSQFPDFMSFDPGQPLPDSSFSNPLYTSSANNQSFTDPTALDPTILDSHLSSQPIQGNLFPNMATQTQSPTPPHLLAPAMHRHSSSPHGSPAMNQGAFQNPSPNHSRHASLDPSSAAYPQNEWGGGANFMGHRRTYSDAHSEVSSAHQSPYLPPADSFDHTDHHHSPHLGAQDPAMYDSVMNIGQVSLSEASPSYISPGHSPHISPALLPTQQQLPQFSENYNLMPTMPPPMNHVLPSSGPEQFPDMRTDLPGQSEAMSPPEISIQFAPPSRTASFEPQIKSEANQSALTPPEKRKWTPWPCHSLD